MRSSGEASKGGGKVGKTRLPTETPPNLAIGAVDLEYALQVFNRLGKVFLGTQDDGDGVHGLDRTPVMTQRLLIGLDGAVEVAHQLRQAAYSGLSVCASHLLQADTLQLMTCAKKAKGK